MLYLYLKFVFICIIFNINIIIILLIFIKHPFLSRACTNSELNELVVKAKDIRDEAFKLPF